MAQGRGIDRTGRVEEGQEGQRGESDGLEAEGEGIFGGGFQGGRMTKEKKERLKDFVLDGADFIEGWRLDHCPCERTKEIEDERQGR